MLVYVGAGDGDVDRADRLRLRTACRAGDAGDADAVRRPETPPGATREGDRDRLGDFAVFGDQFRIDKCQVGFRGGGVADRAAHEVRGTAGDVGDARGEQPARARLGGRNRLAAFDEQAPD